MLNLLFSESENLEGARLGAETIASFLKKILTKVGYRIVQPGTILVGYKLTGILSNFLAMFLRHIICRFKENYMNKTCQPTVPPVKGEGAKWW